MLPQVMTHVSQPGHLTGSESSEQSFPVFAPMMVMPQLQDPAFLFQNQQLLQNAMVPNSMVPSPLLMPQVSADQTTEMEEGKCTTGAEASTSKTPVLAPMIAPPMQLPSNIAPAQFVNPMVFPQMPMAQPQHMQGMQQFVPCMVPGGAFPPTFQPMYFVPQQNAPVFHQPEQHPIMRSDSSHSRHEHSKSYDGSEFSDIKSNSLRRFSSGQSNDGYGSDFWDNRSRMGSEQYEDDDKDEERKAQPQRFYKNQHYEQHNSNKRSYRGRERSRSGSQKRPTSKERQEEMYKTELCSAWVNKKKCRFGHRCIFAHGTHELRSAKRKQDRQNMRPPLKKFCTSLLNRICRGNYDQVMTEFLTVCLEEISDHNIDVEGKEIMKAFFNTAVGDRELRDDLVDSISKLFRNHTYADSLKQFLSDACFTEYNKPRSKDIVLNCIDLVGLLISRRVIGEEVVHQILGDMQSKDPTPIKVELWIKLLEILKDTVETAEYFSYLAKFKSMSTRIRFAIMDLEELKKNNWIPRL